MALIIEFNDLNRMATELVDDPIVVNAGGLPWFTMASVLAGNQFQGNTGFVKHYHDAEEIADSLAMEDENTGHLVEGIYSLMRGMERRMKELIPSGSGTNWIAGRTRGSPSSVVFLRVFEYGCIQNYAYTS